MKPQVKEYLQKIGGKGGKSRSGPKIAAGRRNIQKARQVKKLKNEARKSNVNDSSPIQKEEAI